MTLGLPGNPSDSDDRQSRRATLLALVGVTGNSPDVQRQARDLALQVHCRPDVGAADTGLHGAEQWPRTAATRCSTTCYMAQLPKLSGRPEEYYRVLQRAAIIP